MNFRFSLKTTLLCTFLAAGMVKAATWQWDRHLQKQALIQHLDTTLRMPVVPLVELLKQAPDFHNEVWRRVSFSGTFDFAREVIVRRNRGSNDRAGFHVITPLKLDGTDSYVLVDRGFIPLGRETLETRKQYQQPERTQGFGLIKSSMPRKLFAPNDPPAGLNKPWVDLWIRVDIEQMKQQLPYSVLPIYLETMQDPNDPLVTSKIVKEGTAGKNDVLALTGQKNVENFGMDSPDVQYPVPLFDTTPPPDIHLGYVFEWSFMALLTLGIGVVLQLKRNR
jgi:surfeit locus 1 family protein